MIHLTVSYPSAPGSTFNHEYYRDKHFPLIKARTGDAVKRAEIDRAVGGAAPGVDPAWMAAGHFFFDSMESFQGAFGAHGAELMADVPNFTNVEAQIVVSESELIWGAT